MHTRHPKSCRTMTRASWTSPGKAFLAAGIIGLIVFLLLYGSSIINPTYTAWLLADGGDLSQSYMGWQFYRASGWHFPVGLIDGLIYPNLISVMYIDSIPLFGLLFKLLSPLLPTDFQYFGIWGAVCCVLQGGMASILIWKYNKRIIPCTIGPVFFILSPMVLDRLYGHTALAGQWILLAAMAIWVYRREIGNTWRMLASWAGLFCISPLIHSYFTGMLAFMLLGFLLLDFIESMNIKRIIILICGSGFALFASMYLIGAFHGSIAVDEGGVGEYGLDLLWFMNPRHVSAFLDPIPYARSGQYEGFSYFGLGLLTLIGISTGFGLYSIANRQKLEYSKYSGFIYTHRLAISAAVTAAMLLIYAILPVVSAGGKTLFTAHLPGVLGDLWNTFRSTGRFVWPIWYLFCYVVVVYVSLFPRKSVAHTLLVTALFVQVLDLRPMLMGIHARHAERKTYVSSMDTPEWDEVAANIDHIVFIDPFILGDSRSFSALNDVGNYAIRHGLTVNNYHLSRRNDKQVEAALARQMANPDPDTLYLAPNISNDYPQNAELFYFSNRLVVLFPNSNERLWGILGESPPVKLLNTPNIIDSVGADTEELFLESEAYYVLELNDLPAGIYMLDWRGSHMQGYSFEILCNDVIVEYELYKSRFGMTTIVFSLTQPAGAIELRAINNNGFGARLYSTRLARLK